MTVIVRRCRNQKWKWILRRLRAIQRGLVMLKRTPKLPWHQPQIVDFAIRVPPKKNTWPNFFKIVGEHFASNQTLPIVRPEVRIVSKKTVDGKLRSRKARDLLKEHLFDPVSHCHLKVPNSVIDAIVDGV